MSPISAESPRQGLQARSEVFKQMEDKFLSQTVSSRKIATQGNIFRCRLVYDLILLRD